MDKLKLFFGVLTGVTLYGGATVLGASFSGNAGVAAQAQAASPVATVQPAGNNGVFAASWQQVGGDISSSPNGFSSTANSTNLASSQSSSSVQTTSATPQTSASSSTPTPAPVQYTCTYTGGDGYIYIYPSTTPCPQQIYHHNGDGGGGGDGWGGGGE